MLPTDWSQPSTSALNRLNDRRVRQFWDPNHSVAASLKKAVGKLHPDCCELKGVLWDLIAAYAPGARWPELPPTPTLFNGTVVRAVQGLDSLIVGAGSAKSTPSRE